VDKAILLHCIQSPRSAPVVESAEVMMMRRTSAQDTGSVEAQASYLLIKVVMTCPPACVVRQRLKRPDQANREFI
jgi:hypothetical protein